MSFGGALAAPSTAYIYDWNMLPIGQIAVGEGALLLQGIPAAAGAITLYCASSLRPRRISSDAGAASPSAFIEAATATAACERP